VFLDIFDPLAPPQTLGIDLGTTHSIVATLRDGRPTALVTCDGTGLLPSVVYYGNHGMVMVGNAAKAHLLSEPTRTIASAKRYMGRGYDEQLASQLSHVQLARPQSDADSKVVRFDLGDRTVTPVEVSAEILKSLKKSAIDQLTNVGGVVITVPAYFDEAQRQATKDAGRLAGLDVLRLLNEPTAAALAYGLDKNTTGTYAVYDLGGGTFDITILELQDGVFQVRSTGGDSALGGDDFDRAIAHLMLSQMGFRKDATVPSEVVSLVLGVAREIKHALSQATSAEVKLPVRGDKEITFVLTRDELAALVAPLLASTEVASRRALRDAGLQPQKVEGVILVGGSTRMPAVRAFVEKIFGQTPLTDLDPDLVVAYGAAISAAALSGQGEDVLLLDVLPLSLGVETMGGGVDKILPRNVSIPAGARSTFTTYADNQTGFEVHVVQGERELAQDCRSLARFKVTGIPPMPAGMARLEIDFQVDENSLLHVSARETTTGIEQSIDVTPSYGLSEDEIEQMLIDALDHGEQDLEKRRVADARVEAERVLLATEKSLRQDASLLGPDELSRIQAAISDLRTVLGRAQNSADVKASHISSRLDELDEATKAWAGRRMNQAIAQALGGQQVEQVAHSVETARGVDAHVHEHEQNRAGRRA